MDNLLYEFSKEPNLELLKQIFKNHNFNPNKFHTVLFGVSLLHVRQPYETMKYLLDKGGDPNNNTYLSSKPIHFQKGLTYLEHSTRHESKREQISEGAPARAEANEMMVR